jgi:hypothetical protein
MIITSESVKFYLYELAILLVEKEYFGFIEAADKYVDDIIDYFENNIATAPRRVSTKKIRGYSKHVVYYVVYKRNKRTQWLVYFITEADDYLIIKVSNNHTDHAILKGLL